MARWLTQLPHRPAGWDTARSTTAGVTFAAPTYPTTNADTEGAEPSIKVDRTDSHQRIWITAPTGIGIRTGLAPAGGEFVWYSEDNGLTWTQAGGPTGTTTIVGGGDSDVAPANGSAVYVTGLTLANVTLAASCDNGSTFTTNAASTLGTIEDRQWLDAYVDRPKPADPTAPDFVLDIGLSNLRGTQQNPRVAFFQVHSPSCSPPAAAQPIDTALVNCPLAPPVTIDCYQWPGNLAIDEATGDVCVTYNTLGTDSLNNVPSVNDDKVVVARIAGGASRASTQSDANVVVAAANRPDTFDSFTAGAVDKAGNVYVVWNERHPNAGNPALGETASMYAYSTDHGAHWSTPIQINQGPKTTTFPWIGADDGGKIDVVYYGTDATALHP